MTSPQRSQPSAETTSASATYLLAAAIAAGSGAGFFKKVVDDPAASGLHRQGAFPCTPVAQRESLENPGGGLRRNESIGNSPARRSSLPSPPPSERSHASFYHDQPQQFADPNLTAAFKLQPQRPPLEQ